MMERQSIPLPPLLLLLLQLLASSGATSASSASGAGAAGEPMALTLAPPRDDGRLDAHFTRFGSRIDQLILRLDHLDSRINRFTSLVQGRLDNIENSLTTTKLRMDLYTEELGRIEEQLTRKWKTLESKFDLVLPSVDSKLETKLTLIQRENRRHNDYLNGGFAAMGQRVKDSTDRMVQEMWRLNGTAIAEKCTESIRLEPPTPASNAASTESRLMDLIEEVGNRTTELMRSGSAMQLLSGKVGNMFEDLVQRTDAIQTGLKDVIGTANATRRELQDSVRVGQLKARAAGQQQGGDNAGMSSSESMSAVIVEALASVESISTALGRRVAELGRSIDERFEMVSMSINGFLESCVRIQDGTPLIEEHIAVILEKLLDSFDNSTRYSSNSFASIRDALSLLLNQTTALAACPGPAQTLDEFLNQFLEQESRLVGVETTPLAPPGGSLPASSASSAVDVYESQTQEILRNSDHMSEDEKKTLWASLFPGTDPDQNTLIGGDDEDSDQQQQPSITE